MKQKIVGAELTRCKPENPHLVYDTVEGWIKSCPDKLADFKTAVRRIWSCRVSPDGNAIKVPFSIPVVPHERQMRPGSCGCGSDSKVASSRETRDIIGSIAEKSPA